jgi:hypothetical protein
MNRSVNVVFRMPQRSSLINRISLWPQKKWEARIIDVVQVLLLARTITYGTHAYKQ